MKTIHKRLYQSFPVIPRTVVSSSQPKSTRVRSNSASSSRSLYTANGPSFFDSPQAPPPSSRGHNIVSPARLPLEAKTDLELHLNLQHQYQNSPSNSNQLSPYSQHQSSGPLPPFSLALTTPTNHSSSINPLSHYVPIFPYQSLKGQPTSGAYVYPDSDPSTSTKKQAPRYHLDVGAYGIPKRCKKASSRQHSPSLSRSVPTSHDPSGGGYFAVQVGEDAYFVRENALGVADGVGGWARAKHCDIAVATKGLNDSPSALFARRLMHYCAEEVEASTSNPDYTSPAHPPPSHQLLSHDFPFSHLSETHDLFSFDEDCEYNEDVDDPVDEFEEGLDVLMILERAYDKALKSHVVPAPPSPPSTPSSSTPTEPNDPRQASPLPLPPPDISPTSETVPLLLGSSTALFAVLDYASAKPATSSWREPSISVPDVPAAVNIQEPVIKIAHLGDCMGMLVRGEEIVWRSQEMWSNFNTPLQLGPASSTRPADAQVFTIPVQTDDILILASDGLSDNLWDEEVLDEVVRFRRAFLNRKDTARTRLLGRRTLAGMLSEALCSRARKVSERPARSGVGASNEEEGKEGEETPFARKAREQGRWFSGGKTDDISVLVALISPASLHVPSLL